MSHSIDIYQTHTSAKVIFFPLGYDKEIYKPLNHDKVDPLDVEQYSCDISFLCDNLYLDFPDQIYPRQKLIDEIKIAAQENSWTFHLYGPPHLEHRYPDIYQGDPSYLDKPLIFNFSKVNIVTHATFKKKMYINEHLMSIAACGSSILTDSVRGFYQYFDGAAEIFQENPIDSIKKLLETDTTSMREKIRKLAEPFSWNNFVDAVFIEFNRKNFNEKFYGNSWDYWLSRYYEGIIDIPYLIDIPPNFNVDKYREKELLNESSDQHIYVHWWKHGKDTDFLSKAKNQHSISGSVLSISTTTLLDSFSAFNSIYIYHQIDDGLNQLEKIADRNPRFNVNGALTHYLNLAESE